MSNQNNDDKTRRVIVTSVARIIRSDKVSNLKKNLSTVAQQSGRSVPEVEQFYTEVQQNKILTHFEKTTTGTSRTENTDEFTKYEPIAQVFWQYFAKNGLLEKAVGDIGQFAREIGVEEDFIGQMVRAQRTATTR